MNALKMKRIAKGFTQAQIAQLIGVEQACVSMWETGASQPRAATLKKLAELLACTVDELLKDERG